MTHNEQVFGQDPPSLDPVDLMCGPVRVSFYPETGQLKKALFGQEELLRAIFVAVIAPQGIEIAPLIDHFSVEKSNSAFRVSFIARHRAGDIDILWQGRVIGTPEGNITYIFEGEALSSFEVDRLGLCVLYPSSLQGSRCIVRSTDGSNSQSTFPDLVAPGIPFTDIRAIAHSTESGAEVKVEFVGDTFEMIDQRGIGDNSFKVYPRPESMPKPHKVAKGTKFRQSIHVTTWLDADPIIDTFAIQNVELCTEASVDLPQIGSVLQSDSLNEVKSKFAESLGFEIWRTQIDHETADCELLQWGEDGISDIVLYPPWNDTEAEALRSEHPNVRLHLGSRDEFALLNESRLTIASEGLSFSFGAKGRSADIYDNAFAIRDCVQTAQTFCLGDIHVGPIRFGAGSKSEMKSLISASWTVASLASLLSSGIASATYFSDQTLIFEESVSPAYIVLATLSEMLGAKVFTPKLKGNGIDALHVGDEDGHRLWIANTTSQQTRVSFSGLPASATIRELDGRNVTDACTKPFHFLAQSGQPIRSKQLQLGPYAVAIIDFNLPTIS